MSRPPGSLDERPCGRTQDYPCGQPCECFGLPAPGSLDEQDTRPEAESGGFASEARGTDAYPPERCEVCDAEYAVWYAPSDVWNQACREGDRGKVDEYSFICPTCFTKHAQKRGVKTTGWLVMPSPSDEFPLRYASQVSTRPYDGWQDVSEPGCFSACGVVPPPGTAQPGSLTSDTEAATPYPGAEGDSEEVVSPVSSGGSSVTREALGGAFHDWATADADERSNWAIQRVDAARIVAALVAATARAEDLESRAEGWVQHDTAAYRAATNRAMRRATDAEARADQADRQNGELNALAVSLQNEAEDFRARAAELEAALTEIARSGTDYSPGYGGSWASRVARSALARDDAVGRGQ